MEDTGAEVTWRHVGRIFLSSLRGTGEHLSRTENILHALGSVTSFCCSDKKGVLEFLLLMSLCGALLLHFLIIDLEKKYDRFIGIQKHLFNSISEQV